MTAHSLALILLLMRFVACALIGAVFYRQVWNYRHLHTDYPSVRRTVLLLTLVLLIGQLIPILLDAAAFYGTNLTGRDAHPPLLGSSYAVNNATKDVIIGALLCFLYFRPSGKGGSQ